MEQDLRAGLDRQEGGLGVKWSQESGSETSWKFLSRQVTRQRHVLEKQRHVSKLRVFG